MPERVRDLPPNQRRASPVLPLLLIAAGGVLLLVNLGLLSLMPLLALLNLWPLILIAVGVNLITRGRYRIVVVALTLALAIVWVATGGWGAGDGERVAISIDRGSASSAQIDLRLGVGELLARAHPSPTAPLLSGEVFVAAGEELIERVSDSNDVRNVRVALSAAPGPVQLGRPSEATWSLLLSRELPIDLKVQQGLGRVELDLTDLQLRELNVDGGLGELVLTLPDAGGVRGSVSVGMGSVTVRIPSGVEAQLVVRRGLGAVNVQGNFEVADERYTTPGFASAPADERVELTVQGGVGAISVRQFR